MRPVTFIVYTHQTPTATIFRQPPTPCHPPPDHIRPLALYLLTPRNRAKLAPLPQVYPFSRTGYYALDPKKPPEEKREESKVWVSVGLEPK